MSLLSDKTESRMSPDRAGGGVWRGGGWLWQPLNHGKGWEGVCSGKEEVAGKGSAPFLAEATAQAAVRAGRAGRAGLPEPSGFAPRPDRCRALPRQTPLHIATAYTASNTLEPQPGPHGALSHRLQPRFLDRLPCCECPQAVYRKLTTVNRSADLF